MEGYIRDGLGITDAEITQLKSALLEWMDRDLENELKALREGLEAFANLCKGQRVPEPDTTVT